MDTVLLLSGGLDSATLLYYLISEGHSVKCLSFDYGQRHNKELYSAIRISERAKCKHRIIKLDLEKVLSGSSLIDKLKQIPHGHYTSENMKSIVVPNRNMIMLSIAYSFAINEKCSAVAYAVHSGDHAIYPDCRPEFFKVMCVAAHLCDWHELDLLCPFIDKSKGEIVKIGLGLNVPFELTWTCYEGGKIPCGKCGSCVEREEAFLLNESGDPLCDPV